MVQVNLTGPNYREAVDTQDETLVQDAQREYESAMGDIGMVQKAVKGAGEYADKKKAAGLKKAEGQLGASDYLSPTHQQGIAVEMAEDSAGRLDEVGYILRVPEQVKEEWSKNWDAVSENADWFTRGELAKIKEPSWRAYEAKLKIESLAERDHILANESISSSGLTTHSDYVTSTARAEKILDIGLRGRRVGLVNEHFAGRVASELTVVELFDPTDAALSVESYPKEVKSLFGGVVSERRADSVKDGTALVTLETLGLQGATPDQVDSFAHNLMSHIPGKEQGDYRIARSEAIVQSKLRGFAAGSYEGIQVDLSREFSNATPELLGEVTDRIAEETIRAIGETDNPDMVIKALSEQIGRLKALGYSLVGHGLDGDTLVMSPQSVVRLYGALGADRFEDIVGVVSVVGDDGVLETALAEVFKNQRASIVESLGKILSTKLTDPTLIATGKTSLTLQDVQNVLKSQMGDHFADKVDQLFTDLDVSGTGVIVTEDMATAFVDEVYRRAQLISPDGTNRDALEIAVTLMAIDKNKGKLWVHKGDLVKVLEKTEGGAVAEGGERLDVYLLRRGGSIYRGYVHAGADPAHSDNIAWELQERMSDGGYSSRLIDLPTVPGINVRRTTGSEVPDGGVVDTSEMPPGVDNPPDEGKIREAVVGVLDKAIREADDPNTFMELLELQGDLVRENVAHKEYPHEEPTLTPWDASIAAATIASAVAAVASRVKNKLLRADLYGPLNKTLGEVMGPLWRSGATEWAKPPNPGTALAKSSSSRAVGPSIHSPDFKWYHPNTPAGAEQVKTLVKEGATRSEAMAMQRQAAVYKQQALARKALEDLAGKKFKNPQEAKAFFRRYLLMKGKDVAAGAGRVGVWIVGGAGRVGWNIATYPYKHWVLDKVLNLGMPKVVRSLAGKVAGAGLGRRAVAAITSGAATFGLLGWQGFDAAAEAGKEEQHDRLLARRGRRAPGGITSPERHLTERLEDAGWLSMPGQDWEDIAAGEEEDSALDWFQSVSYDTKTFISDIFSGDMPDNPWFGRKESLEQYVDIVKGGYMSQEYNSMFLTGTTTAVSYKFPRGPVSRLGLDAHISVHNERAADVYEEMSAALREQRGEILGYTPDSHVMFDVEGFMASDLYGKVESLALVGDDDAKHMLESIARETGASTIKVVEGAFAVRKIVRDAAYVAINSPIEEVFTMDGLAEIEHAKWSGKFGEELMSRTSSVSPYEPTEESERLAELYDYMYQSSNGDERKAEMFVYHTYLRSLGNAGGIGAYMKSSEEVEGLNSWLSYGNHVINPDTGEYTQDITLHPDFAGFVVWNAMNQSRATESWGNQRIFPGMPSKMKSEALAERSKYHGFGVNSSPEDISEAWEFYHSPAGPLYSIYEKTSSGHAWMGDPRMNPSDWEADAAFVREYLNSQGRGVEASVVDSGEHFDAPGIMAFKQLPDRMNHSRKMTEVALSEDRAALPESRVDELIRIPDEIRKDAVLPGSQLVTWMFNTDPYYWSGWKGKVGEEGEDVRGIYDGEDSWKDRLVKVSRERVRIHSKVGSIESLEDAELVSEDIFGLLTTIEELLDVSAPASFGLSDRARDIMSSSAYTAVEDVRKALIHDHSTLLRAYQLTERQVAGYQSILAREAFHPATKIIPTGPYRTGY